MNIILLEILAHWIHKKVFFSKSSFVHRVVSLCPWECCLSISGKRGQFKTQTSLRVKSGCASENLCPPRKEWSLCPWAWSAPASPVDTCPVGSRGEEKFQLLSPHFWVTSTLTYLDKGLNLSIKIANWRRYWQRLWPVSKNQDFGDSFGIGSWIFHSLHWEDIWCLFSEGVPVTLGDFGEFSQVPSLWTSLLRVLSFHVLTSLERWG